MNSFAIRSNSGREETIFTAPDLQPWPEELALTVHLDAEVLDLDAEERSTPVPCQTLELHRLRATHRRQWTLKSFLDGWNGY